MYQVQLAFRYAQLCVYLGLGGGPVVYVVCIYLKISIAFPPLRANPVQTPCISTYIYIVYILYPKGPSRLLFSSQKTHTHTHTSPLLCVCTQAQVSIYHHIYKSKRKKERKAANGSQNVRQSSSRSEQKKKNKSISSLFIS